MPVSVRPSAFPESLTGVSLPALWPRCAPFQWPALIKSPPAKEFVIVLDPQSPPPGLEGAVVAIGNFDGVHRGHVAVLRRALALAPRLGRPCAGPTFGPHPSDYFFG